MTLCLPDTTLALIWTSIDLLSIRIQSKIRWISLKNNKRIYLQIGDNGQTKIGTYDCKISIIMPVDTIEILCSYFCLTIVDIDTLNMQPKSARCPCIKGLTISYEKLKKRVLFFRNYIMFNNIHWILPSLLVGKQCPNVHYCELIVYYMYGTSVCLPKLTTYMYTGKCW